MKTIFTLLIFISSLHFVKAQSWAAPGATWYYDFQYFAQTGYERIQNIGDTFINSKQYNKLQIYRYYFDQSSQQSGGYYVPQLEFTREDSGVVYDYRDTADFILYDFNALPGDQWIVKGDPQFSASMCDTGSVHVDSISSTVINSTTLRIIYTSPNSYSAFMGPLIEKLGCTGYMFPYQNCLADIPQGYNLRCYEDSSGWSYHNPNLASNINSYGCAYVMSVNDIPNENGFSIYPSLADQYLQLNFPHVTSPVSIPIVISDLYGRTITTQLISPDAKIDVSNLVDGIYFIYVQNLDCVPRKFEVVHH